MGPSTDYLVRLDILGAQYTVPPSIHASIQPFALCTVPGQLAIRVESFPIDWLPTASQPDGGRRSLAFRPHFWWGHPRHEAELRASPARAIWDASRLGGFREAFRASSGLEAWDTHLRLWSANAGFDLLQTNWVYFSGFILFVVVAIPNV